MVSELALYSDNPCLNTATVLSVHGLKKPKMNVKEAGMDHLPKNQVTNTIVLCTYFFAVVVWTNFRLNQIGSENDREQPNGGIQRCKSYFFRGDIYLVYFPVFLHFANKNDFHRIGGNCAFCFRQTVLPPFPSTWQLIMPTMEKFNQHCWNHSKVAEWSKRLPQSLMSSEIAQVQMPIVG